jgi:hypothetical protein
MGALSVLKKAKPLVSKFDEALANIQRPKGTGDEFLTEVMKQPGVKKAEVEDRKLRQAFEKAGKMTKAEAQALAAKNANPKIEERIFAEIDDNVDEMMKIAERDYGQPFEDLPPDIRDEIADSIMGGAESGTQYGEYILPGGSNYREIVLKLPSMPDAEKERLMTLEAKYRRMSQPSQWVFEESAEGLEMKALKDKAEQAAYYSSHWGKDEPNVLAHMRVQDRVGPNGEKILHVEEIQSDWHQAGRKKGYFNEAAYQEARKKADDVARAAGFNDASHAAEGWKVHGMPNAKEASNLYDEATNFKSATAVPDAPFKKNWHELAMKRLINHAAENGYDKIAITPGAEQASRYDLSKQVDELLYKKNDDGTYRILARTGGEDRIIEESVAAKKLEDYVGKDVAQKIIDGEGSAAQARRFNPATQYMDQDPMQSLSGLDLQVGGEGMKGFYDKMLPDYLNTLGKKYGTQVRLNDLPVRKTEDLNFPVMGDLPQHVPGEQSMVHTFDITPELREEVTTKGLPLYNRFATPGLEGLAAGTGAATIAPEVFEADNEQQVQNPVHFTENPDAMLLELMQRK